MKIVSYNINISRPWKINRLLAMDADVLVVPEITCPNDAHLPADYEMKWYALRLPDDIGQEFLDNIYSSQ